MIDDAQLAEISGIMLVSFSSLLAIMIAVLIFTVQSLNAMRGAAEQVIMEYSSKLYELFSERHEEATSLFGSELRSDIVAGIAWLMSEEWKEIKNDLEYTSKVHFERQREILSNPEILKQMNLQELEFHNRFYNAISRVNVAIYRFLLAEQLNHVIYNQRWLCLTLAGGAILSLFSTIYARIGAWANTTYINSVLMVCLGLLALTLFIWLVLVSFKVVEINRQSVIIPDVK